MSDDMGTSIFLKTLLLARMPISMHHCGSLAGNHPDSESGDSLEGGSARPDLGHRKQFVAHFRVAD